MEDLTQLYEQAAEQVRAAIAQAGQGGRVPVAQLQALLGRLDAVLEALGQARDEAVQQAIEQAAQLGVQPFTSEGLAATGRQVAPVLNESQALMQVDRAVRFVREFRAEDGLSLSDRLWRLNQGARQALQRQIELGVVQGWNADRAAAEFVMAGQAVPAGTQLARQAAATERLMQGADYLQDPAKGALASALRVMRTEINRAHGEAYMAGAEAAPGVVGFRFLLSPLHPRPDICDLYARQNLHGLGPGVYPSRKVCPWPAHPNTLSFVVAVFAPEVSDADRAGTETTMQALERLGPEVRAGILGPTKADYFDRGLLTRGMVRSRVGSVRERLRR